MTVVVTTDELLEDFAEALERASAILGCGLRPDRIEVAYNAHVRDFGLTFDDGRRALVEIGPSAFGRRDVYVRTLLHEATHVVAPAAPEWLADEVAREVLGDLRDEAAEDGG